MNVIINCIEWNEKGYHLWEHLQEQGGIAPPLGPPLNFLIMKRAKIIFLYLNSFSWFPVGCTVLWNFFLKKVGWSQLPYPSFPWLIWQWKTLIQGTKISKISILIYIWNFWYTPIKIVNLLLMINIFIYNAI